MLNCTNFDVTSDSVWLINDLRITFRMPQFISPRK